jgi:hypothetical protein
MDSDIKFNHPKPLLEKEGNNTPRLAGIGTPLKRGI